MKKKLTHEQARAAADVVWKGLCEEIAREIHGDERDFKEEPLNAGEWMTVRQRATPKFAELLNRAQRRAVGFRRHRTPPRMATKIKQRA